MRSAMIRRKNIAINRLVMTSLVYDFAAIFVIFFSYLSMIQKRADLQRSQRKQIVVFTLSATSSHSCFLSILTWGKTSQCDLMNEAQKAGIECRKSQRDAGANLIASSLRLETKTLSLISYKVNKR